MIPIRETAAGTTFAIRVQPGAKKTAITGIYGEGDSAALKIQLAAPPIDGRANQAVVDFFAEIFGVPKRQVSILFGEASRSKVIQVSGTKSAAVARALQPSLES